MPLRSLSKIVGGLVLSSTCSRVVFSNDQKRRNRSTAGLALIAPTCPRSLFLISKCDGEKESPGFFEIMLNAEEEAAELKYSKALKAFSASQLPLGILKLWKSNNLPEALDFFQFAANQNIGEAQLTLAIVYQCHPVIQNFEEARRYLILAANQGVSRAQLILALCHSLGKCGFAKNMQEVERLLELSAAQRDVEAQVMLADLYRGHEFDRNPTEQDTQALHYFKLAARQGNSYAASQTGHLLLERGDINEGMWYLRNAATKGEISARAVLGRCLIEGTGVDETDADVGLNWIHEAADKECIDAYKLLAELYAEGAPGVPQSPELAQKYKDLIEEKKWLQALWWDVLADPNFWKLMWYEFMQTMQSYLRA